MKNPYCIGLCGQKQVGKDTICEILIPILNKKLMTSFERVAFADAVKNVLGLFHYRDDNENKVRVNREWIENNKENVDYIPKGWETNVRGALCKIGDRFREIDGGVWIDIALLNNSKDKIITDVRYPNEAYEIHKNASGLVIKIIRPGFETKEGHRSETSMLEFDDKIPCKFEGPCMDPDIPYDYILRNDSDKEELKEKIHEQIVPWILKKWKYFIVNSY